MEASHTAGPLLLIVLPFLYVYALCLPVADVRKRNPRRDINAVCCLISLAYAAAAFLFDPGLAFVWYGLLTWAIMPGIAAGIAGRRPFLYLSVSSVCAASAVMLCGNGTASYLAERVGSVFGFILVVIALNVLGTFLLFPLLGMWEYRRRQQGKQSAVS